MKHERLTIALFCTVLGAFALLYVLLPKSDFSENEKRVLAQTPELSAENLLDGSFEAQTEAWFSDHVPFRNALVGINAHLNLYLGQNGTNGVIKAGDRLFAAPAEYDEAHLATCASTVNRFADTTGVPVSVMLIPESGYELEALLPKLHAQYSDGEAAQYLRQTLNVPLLFPESELAFSEMYYRTDHHYTALGAYTAASLYAQSINSALPSKDFYTIESCPGYLGSMYSKAGLWEIKSENIEIWTSPTEMSVSIEEDAVCSSPFFRQHLAEMDKYPVYLDGNHAIVRIKTGNDCGEKLLIVRDSFGHCFAPFIAECFSEVILIDLRYYRQSASELIKSENIDRVLILYGMDTFLTDTNIIRLK